MKNKNIEFNFEAGKTDIGKILFSNDKYEVPRYQRSYSWEEDQAVDFWNDLTSESASYFIGSFVFNYENIDKTGHIDVIDGQQRLLTIIILMAVLRDIYKQIGDIKGADRIQRMCIAFEDKYGNLTYRIKSGDTIQQYFNKYIQAGDLNIEESQPKNKEEKRIKKVYLFLKERIQEHIDNLLSTEEKRKFIQGLWDNVDAIKVVSIQIQNEEGAYEIFETLNARGVELSVADLLKNYMFKNIKLGKDNNKDIVKEKWLSIDENIKATGTDLKRFFRYYWLSKYAFVTDKKLFREIKTEIKDHERFLENLVGASEWFNKFYECNRVHWDEIKDGHKIFESLCGIKLMDVTQCYVLFMSILRNMTKLGTRVKRVFEIIEKFTFKYFVICRLPGNKVERLYSKYARELERIINSSKPKHIPGNIQALFVKLEKELKSISPSFEEFKENFLELSYRQGEKSRQLIKYILEKIDAFKRKGAYKIDFDAVNIEHILPQNPGKEWNLKKSEIKNYVNKIGNLTLIKKEINSKVGNKSIKNKVKILKEESEVTITGEIIDRIVKLSYKWGEKEILERQNELAELAYNKVWSF